MNFKTITSEEQNAGIRMLKCYLASDRRGHFVTTSEAANMPGQVWGCVDLTLYIQTPFLSYGCDNFLRIYSRGERYPSALCG